MDIINLNKYLIKLPNDLVNYIITLTYKPQPKELLQDIINYYNSKQLIKEYYCLLAIIFHETYEESIEWVVNDLVLYMNSSLPTLLGYSEKMEFILIRSNLISTSEDLDLYFFVLLKKNVLYQLNILLGLLTPPERNEFINIKLKINNNNI
jgi:hypothetical protein